MNATRLTRSKESTIERYRGLLEARLGCRFPDPVWDEMVAVGVLAGARMLLWSKALALQGGTDAARREWQWWAERLSRQ